MFKVAHNPPALTDPVGLPAASGCRLSSAQSAAMEDDLGREVYGLLGIPIDAMDRCSVMEKIIHVIGVRRPLLLSTPNVNFLIESKRDSGFRESLIQSDLCAIDGMPLVWLARFLSIPIKERVSGSDLFDAIRRYGDPSRPVRCFLFGGADGVSETVCEILNSQPGGFRCVGWLNPGYGTVDEMSTQDTIEKINNSGADLLAVFLSAKKAQAWLLKNHNLLSIPVQGQFGATINYQAGTVSRAPLLFQQLGFEWLWRIKEEPYLWRRYLRDGLSLINLVIFRALPISINLWRGRGGNGKLVLSTYEQQNGSIAIRLAGHATKTHATEAIACFRRALSVDRNIVIDVSETSAIDPRFFGLFLMLRKTLTNCGRNLIFSGLSKNTTRLFHLHGFGFLLRPLS